MSRIFAFLAALALTAISVSSSCLASSADNIRFQLQPSGQAGQVHLSLFSGSDGHHSNMGSTFRASELAGLNLASLAAPGNNPVSFALVRDAGRVDCAGAGGSSAAAGTCRFTADANFSNFLASHGIQRPDRDQAYALTMVEASRALVQAVIAARYTAPSIDDLTALAAVGVTPQYIDQLAGRGYKPAALDDLVQLRALNVTPEFIAGFERIGYRRLPIDTLVQLKALDVTPAYVQQLRQNGFSSLPIDKLVQMKALHLEPSRRH